MECHAERSEPFADTYPVWIVISEKGNHSGNSVILIFKYIQISMSMMDEKYSTTKAKQI